MALKEVKGERGKEGEEEGVWGEGEEGHRAAHYMSANCVIFTYYTGEVSKALDTHFTASLSPAARDPLPLSARWAVTWCGKCKSLKMFLDVFDCVNCIQ